MKIATVACVAAMVALMMTSTRVRARLGQLVSMRTECREGVLMLLDVPESDAFALRPGRYCVLLRAAVSARAEAPDAELRELGLYWGSDGLEASVCSDHADALNHQVGITGVRVSGKRIGQDCLNRSCFSSVTLR